MSGVLRLWSICKVKEPILPKTIPKGWTGLTCLFRRHAIPCHAMPRHAIPCHSTPRHATPHHATPRHATPRHATPRHATPRHTMPCHATPCHAMPYHAMPRSQLNHFMNGFTRVKCPLNVHVKSRTRTHFTSQL